VADAVLHALTAARPRTRYPVGQDARVGMLVASYTTDRFMDWFLARMR
jgi:hypothetical protein